MLCLVNASVFAQDNMEDKVSEFLELTGAKARFYMVIDQMIDLQKNGYGETIENEFFEEFRAKVKDNGYEEILEKLMPVYLKYFSEEEMDGLLAFYKSDIGKSFTEKQPMVMQETMAIGAEWGEKISEDILSTLLAESDKREIEYKFSKVISEDLDRFKKGEFYFYNEDVKVELIREGNKQIERDSNESKEYIIEWNSNNNYTVKDIKPNGDIDDSRPMVVNIYEVKKNSYRCVARIISGDNTFYMDGEIFIAK